MSDPATEILGRAVEWARHGGQMARARFGQSVSSRKHDQTLVTDADHAVQDAIVHAVASTYPHHAVFTEETLAHADRHAPAGEAEWCWVIDPIDGTANYARQVPCFSVSIGVLRAGRPAVAAVYAVMTDQMYAARRGGGAWCGGRRLAVADGPMTGDTMIGAPSSRGGAMPKPAHAWCDAMTMRNFGSAALHQAMVASGALDAAFCTRCKLWDIAAGALLITEAGGVFTDMAGRDYFPITVPRPGQTCETPFIAAGPTLHPQLIQSWQANA
jgi:myo-inositol-1(or 4)-monophosphatase